MGWLVRALFDWVFVLFFGLLQGLLYIVSFVGKFFDLFAGTSKVLYKGNADFLINIFFAHDGVGNAFWAMALIAIVMAFGFCIVSVSRKVTDVSGTVKQSLGQIFSNFIRCLLIILMLNAVALVTVNASNVLLDRINFALSNASVLNRDGKEKTFTNEEYAAMTKILSTVANYSVNPSADSRYNVNSCFNAVRQDLLALSVNGFFDYDYPLDDNGHNTWQSALALLSTSADLTKDLSLDTYYAETANAFKTIVQELKNNPNFAPVQTARVNTSGAITTDNLIFLITGMEAANNKQFNNGKMDDALRRGYWNNANTGSTDTAKSYMNLKQVRSDFDIWKINYFVGYVASLTFILIMLICIFTFIVRLFNLLLLYLTAPLFVSSMPLDDGAKFQSWMQAFVIQLFSGFGSLIAMRLYLIIIPIVISSDLEFFQDSAFLNYMAQLLMILAGAWAVLKASGLITGILAGNPGMAAIQQEGQIGGAITHGAARFTHAMASAPGKLVTAPADAVNKIKGVGNAYKSAFGKSGSERKPRDGGGDKGDGNTPGTSGDRARGVQTGEQASQTSTPQSDAPKSFSPKSSASRSNPTQDSGPKPSAPKLRSNHLPTDMPVVNTKPKSANQGYHSPIQQTVPIPPRPNVPPKSANQSYQGPRVAQKQQGVEYIPGTNVPKMRPLKDLKKK